MMCIYIYIHTRTYTYTQLYYVMYIYIFICVSAQKCQGVPCSPNLPKFNTFAAAPLGLTPFVRDQ